jgi:hypothetical protein
VRDLLGHSTTRTTDRYTHSNDARRQSVVESLLDRRKTG